MTALTTRYINQFRTNLTTEEVLALAKGDAKPMWKETAYVWVPFDKDGVLTTTYADQDDWEAACEELETRELSQFSCPVQSWQAMFEQI